MTRRPVVSLVILDAVLIVTGLAFLAFAYGLWSR